MMITTFVVLHHKYYGCLNYFYEFAKKAWCILMATLNKYPIAAKISLKRGLRNLPSISLEATESFIQFFFFFISIRLFIVFPFFFAKERTRKRERVNHEAQGGWARGRKFLHLFTPSVSCPGVQFFRVSFRVQRSRENTKKRGRWKDWIAKVEKDVVLSDFVK